MLGLVISNFCNKSHFSYGLVEMIFEINFVTLGLNAEESQTQRSASYASYMIFCDSSMNEMLKSICNFLQYFVLTIS